LKNREIRAWSAGCSTGEEAYTLSMVLQESFPNLDIKILATDIDQKVLKKAVSGEYGIGEADDVERYYLAKYFKKTDRSLFVCDEIKSKVTFRQFNLMNKFSFKKGFDIIFCRNVMIYFDAPTQQKILKKFYDALVPGGLLFIGHSEGITDKNPGYIYVQPTVYRKEA
jgi:chemotaxis protein methyltransferase CheR